MAHLMKHAPATQYFLLDRPGSSAALVPPPPEPRATTTTVARRASSGNTPVRLPAASFSATATNTEEQLIQYLRETYGQPRPSSDELRNMGHMPFLSSRW